MKIDVRNCTSYKFLTENGKKAAAHCNGRVKIEPDTLAEQANGVIAFLSGKNFNYYHVAMILDVAKDSVKEEMLTRTL